MENKTNNKKTIKFDDKLKTKTKLGPFLLYLFSYYPVPGSRPVGTIENAGERRAESGRETGDFQPLFQSFLLTENLEQCVHPKALVVFVF